VEKETQVDHSRFDDVVKSLSGGTRRSLLRLMAGTAAGALVIGSLGLEEAAAACVKPGKKCDKKDKCCGGAKCKGGKCKCTNGGATCGKACCAPGQICEDAASSTCANGPLQPGDFCDPDQPLECQSGECECVTIGENTACECRQQGCFGQGIECTKTSQCCKGFCSEFEDPPVCVTVD
jgi:hypothetical protein